MLYIKNFFIKTITVLLAVIIGYFVIGKPIDLSKKEINHYSVFRKLETYMITTDDMDIIDSAFVNFKLSLDLNESIDNQDLIYLYLESVALVEYDDELYSVVDSYNIFKYNIYSLYYFHNIVTVNVSFGNDFYGNSIFLSNDNILDIELTLYLNDFIEINDSIFYLDIYGVFNYE